MNLSTRINSSCKETIFFNYSRNSTTHLMPHQEGWETLAEPMTRSQKTAMAVYFMSLIASSIVFNGLLIFAIGSSWQRRSSSRGLLTVPSIFVINMALCDLITAIFVVPFDVDYLIRGVFPFGEGMCAFREIAFFLSLPSSVNCLLLLTLERFVSIVFPFKRIRYVHIKTSLVVIIMAWMYSLVFAVMPLWLMQPAVAVLNNQCYFRYPVHYIYVMLALNFFAPLCAIVAMNLVLFNVASKHAGDMKRRSLVGTRRKVRPSMIKLGANLKAAKTVLVLVVVFLVCWLTLIVLSFLNTLCGICHPRYLTYLGNAINYTSLTLNPILYGLRNSEIRRRLNNLKTSVLDWFGCFSNKSDALDSSRSIVTMTADSDFLAFCNQPNNDSCNSDKENDTKETVLLEMNV